MGAIRHSDHGIVVDHLESGVRFAISDKHYDVKVHRKVRELGPGESVRTFKPLKVESLSEAVDTAQHKTEGSSSEASQEKKEGN